jgi:hypothetical protein
VGIKNAAVYSDDLCPSKPPGWADVQLEMHKIYFLESSHIIDE